jgi:antirestriction protein
MTIETPTMHLDDTIDVRDIIERIEELESSKDDHKEDPAGGYWSDDDEQELQTLADLMDELKGNGGDEQWRGDWYPVTLIRESYFTDYTEELVSECYDLRLPDFVHVDWEATARDVKVDYSTVEIDGVTFFYR